MILCHGMYEKLPIYPHTKYDHFIFTNKTTTYNFSLCVIILFDYCLLEIILVAKF
jgi:hypothetical protein